MRLRWSRVALWAFGVVVLLLAAVVIVIQTIDWNTFRPEFERRVLAATGRKLEIIGDVDFRLFPKPVIVADGLRFANAPWGSEPNMLEAKSVRFVLAPLYLLMGRIHARAIELHEVRVLLEDNVDGEHNWNVGSGAGGGEGVLDIIFPKLERLELDGLDLDIKRPQRAPIAVDVASASLRSRGVGREVGIEIRGEANGEPVSVSGSLRIPATAFAISTWQGELAIEGAEETLHLEGDFGRLPDLEGLSLAVRGEGSRMPAVGPLTSVPDAYRGQWQAQLKVAKTDEGYDLSGVQLTLGDADIAGEGSLSVVKERPRFKGKLSAATPAFTVQLDGDTGRLPDLDGLDLKLEGHGSRLPPFGPLARVPQDFQREWQAAVHVKGSPQRLALRNLDVRLGGNNLQGTLTVSGIGDRLRLEGQLAADALDVRELLHDAASDDPAARSAQVHKEPGSSDRKRVFSTEPLGLEALRSFDATLDLSVGRLAVALLTGNDVEGSLELENGRLRFQPRKGKVYGADVTGQISLDVSAQPAKWSSSSTAMGADMAQITGEWSDPPFMTGQGDFDLAFTATGDSVAALMQNLSGHVRLLTGEGTARAGVAERAVKTVIWNQLTRLMRKGDESEVKMNCFAADFAITDGVAEAQVLILDTENSTVRGAGSVDLGKEEWDLAFKPKPKTPTLNTAVPIKIGGTFLEPTFTVGAIGTLRKLAGAISLFVFPPAAIAGLGEFGSADNVCLKLAAEE